MEIVNDIAIICTNNCQVECVQFDMMQRCMFVYLSLKVTRRSTSCIINAEHPLESNYVSQCGISSGWCIQFMKDREHLLTVWSTA